MSRMFEQAIIDAEALKEAAIKNAETELIEKYSEDIKQAVENLLEQGPPGAEEEEPPEGEMPPDMMAMMGGGGMPPPGGAPPPGGMPPPGAMGPEGGPPPGEEVADELAPSWPEEGEELCPCPDDEEEVTLSLSGLSQLMGVGEEPEAGEMLAGEEAAREVMGEPTEEEQFLVQESMLNDILGEGDMSDELYEEEELEEGDPVRGYAPKDENLASLEANIDELELSEDLFEGFELEEDYDTEVYEEAKGDEGPYSGGPRDHFDKDGDGVPDGADSDDDDPDVNENIKSHIAQLEERLQAYDYHYTMLYENYVKLDENYTKLNETHESTIDENKNKNKKETISNKTKKRFENLKKENKNHRQLTLALKDKLNEVNLSNAKLLYTNRVLNSDSLNERQKDKIVEAVSKAGTVGEAKTIFDTLQSAVEGASSSRKASKSLNEAVANNSSAFLPRREVKDSDPSLVDRMQKLAGITKI